VPWTDFVTPENLSKAWTMSKALRIPYSQIVGMSGIEAYAIDAAVVRWGTAFDAAVSAATDGSKSRAQADNKVQTVIRRWIPSSRKYR
jgi:hypothetical protein